MKRVLGVLTILASCTAHASPIEPGDTRAKVFQHLGEPQGRVQMEGVEWLLYPRGKVWLKEGVVAKADLLSPEALAAKQVEDERARIEKQIRLESQRLERIQKGTALRDQLLENPEFYLKSARERLSLWERFRHDYPEVDVSDHYLAALEAVRVERERNKQDDKIRRLEERVRAAELRALDAQQASVERNRSRRIRYSYDYPVVYGPSVHPCVRTRVPASSRDHHAGHPLRPAGSPPSRGISRGSVALQAGPITMKPVTFGHVKVSF